LPFPDGIVVDAAAGHIYWSNMGVPNLDDGSIERADLDGGDRKVIVPQGVTHTRRHQASPRWERYVGPKDAIIGVTRFGASAPGPVVMREYGFTPEHVVDAVKAVLTRCAEP
jgi:transketolase-like protein